MNVLLLCAGKQARWTEETPKQLADFGGEPLLLRTIRQVVKRGHTPIVVTHRAEIKAAVVGLADVFEPEYHRWLMETIHQTRNLWDGPTVVLLGDVCFTGAALDTIFQGGVGTPQLYGTDTEVFAVRFTPYDLHDLYAPYAYAGAHADDETAGRLWSLYRSLSGLPNQPHVVPLRDGDPYFTYIEDGTNDFDDTDGYAALKAKFDAGELLEDAPKPVTRARETIKTDMPAPTRKTGDGRKGKKR